MIRELVSDALIVAGLAGTGWGVYQMHPPSAYIFAGLSAVAYGILLAPPRRTRS